MPIFLLLLLSACSSEDPVLPSKHALPCLRFSIAQKHLNLLKRKRHEALQEGILISKSKDFVPVKIAYEGQEISAEVRLKGDWLDHLKGSKWSLRVHLDDAFSILGMQRFSLQHPRTRSYLEEWVFHQLLEKEKLLTPSYTFVQVWWNDEYKGIYALEEHFSQSLLARQQRRDGPILKFVEDGFWQLQSHRMRHGKDLVHFLPVFESAAIDCFQSNKVRRDSQLNMLFQRARHRLHDFRSAQRPASELIDTDQLARYYALADLATAYHSLRWHNLRFYYNAYLGKLEPIIFDAFGDEGPYRWFSKPFIGYSVDRHRKVYFAKEYMIYYPFNEPTFQQQYIYYLEKFSHPDYLANFIEAMDPQVRFLETALQSEYNNYHYSFARWLETAAKIRQHLPEHIQDHPPFEYTIFLLPGVECAPKAPVKAVGLKAIPQQNRQKIFLQNYFCRPIKIHATGPKKSKPIHILDKPIELPPFDIYHQPPKADSIPFFPKDRFVFYSVTGIDYWYKQKIARWSKPEEMDFVDLQRLQMDSSIFQWKENRLVLPKGQHQLNGLTVIPDTVELIVEAGAQIDLLNGAACLIAGPTSMLGTPPNPITVTSSDRSGKGIHFLQNPKTTRLVHVQFSHLNEWQDEGLSLSGGVSFYQTKVDIKNCSFSHSQSEDALNIVESDSASLTNVRFSHCQSDAIDFDFSTFHMQNAQFQNIGGDAIDLSGSKGNAEGLFIRNVVDKGLSVGEHSLLHFNQVELEGSHIGVAVKDSSSVVGRDLQIKQCSYGIAVFKKKAYFGKASLQVDQVQWGASVQQPLLLEEGHELRIDSMVQKWTHPPGTANTLFYPTKSK
ncbi:MAG: CotH kinase family protein [Bacteroidota bacterium]